MRLPRCLTLLLVLIVVLCVVQTAEARGRLGQRLHNLLPSRHATATAAPAAEAAPAAVTAPAAAAVKTIDSAPSGSVKPPKATDLKFDPVPNPIKTPAKVPVKAVPMTKIDGAPSSVQTLTVGSITLTSGEQNMLNEMNRQRTSRGIRPIAADEGLMRSARSHAQWMASNHRMQHAPNVTETIAMNMSNTVAAIGQWINSPPHRNIMLSSGLGRVGLSGYTRNGRSYYTAQYGR